MANLKSLTNIKLAWLRTLTGENTDYRNLQRIEIDSFGWAEDDNLLHLYKELLDNSFSASKSTKIFVPKPSGLLRPITILRIKDTIIYQAIANIIAEKAIKHISPNYFVTTFSNILTITPGYPYFYKKWRYGRRKLDQKRKDYFKQGYTWFGELDLTSFYDVIDHDALREMLVSFYKDEDALELLLSCLSQWTAHSIGLKHGHGIPQGPLPSSLIAECVMYFLDRRVTNLKNSVYLRYVDDITIMSKSEKDSKKLFSKIDVFCRELGLIPQVKKPIIKLNNIEDLMFPQPYIVQSNPSLPTRIPNTQNEAIRKKFLGCFRKDKLNSKDEQIVSKLNYSLFHMNPDKRILNKVLNLLNKMPCVGIATNYYLRKFGENTHICNWVYEYLDNEPIYDIVLASCLETIYIVCVSGQISRLRNVCRKFLNRKYNTILRATAVKILGLRKICIKELEVMLAHNNDPYLTEHLLLALSNSLTVLAKQQTFNQFIRVQDHHVALTSAYMLTNNNLRLTRPIKDVNPWASPILKNKGLIKKRIMGDRIGEIISKRYGITLPIGFSFRSILTRVQYKQALLHLNWAEGGFATNRSFWVTEMDNFDQIILTLVYKKLGINCVKGSEFGSISSKLLRTKFPSLAAVFEKCHIKRSLNPVPHSYSTLLGTFSRSIKPRERDELQKELKIAYQEFINKI